MKNPLIAVLLTSTLVFFSGCGKPGSKAKESSTSEIKPARETSFAEVTSQLDPGGSVYGYLSTDQWLAGLSTNVLKLNELVSTLPDIPDADRQQIRRVINTISHAVEKCGVETLTGIGISGVQITPELNRTKFILHHRKGQGDGVFWNVMGKEPHALAGLTLLTTNTALASFGDLDVPMLWKTIESELRSAGIPELTKALDEWPKT
ncbi:MAG TPA: hypothetical protein VK327_14680, partial [Candidatus Paceibacterota bacterium]|nr:hypothetical protein [Candidatus Paceibacterota bacterium]